MSSYENSITIAKVKDGTPGQSITITNTSKVDGVTTITFSDGSSVSIADGQQGRSITRVVQSYLATASSVNVTPSTSGWTSTIQTISSTSQYLWNFERVYSGDSETDIISSTDPVIIGRYGKDGGSGKGISNIEERYITTNSTSVPSYGSAWTSTLQVTTSTSRYLWNYEIITYDDNGTTSRTSTDRRIIGTHGETGQQGPQGKSITYVKELYYCTTATTITAPTQAVTCVSPVYNEWTQACPDWQSNYIYYTCTEIGYSDNGITTPSWTPVISNGGYNTANQVASNAQTSAGQAATAASGAQTAAQAAQSAANAAATSASNAQTAAQNAATSASQAATSASQAVTSANQAITVASEAKTSAQTAYNTATSAVTAASSAVSTANNAYTIASSAQSLAESKNRTYAQNTAPTTNLVVGDLWIDTSDNNRTYRWDGNKWVDIETDGINLLYNSASLDIAKTPYANSSAVLSSTVDPRDGEYFYQSSGAKYIRVDFSGLVSGNNYVFSFDGIRNASAKNVYVTFTGGSPSTAQNLGSMTSTVWNRYSKVFTATSTSGYAKVQISPVSTSGTSTYIGAYRHFKLEKGNIATDWCLAPGEEIQSADIEYCLSESHEQLSGSETWSTNTPTWTEGLYIWSRTAWKHIDGTISYSNPTCITGNTGAPGDAIKYEVGFSHSKILKFYENSGDNQSSKVFNTSFVDLWLDKIENGQASRLTPKLTSPDYKMNISFYSGSVTIKNLFELLDSITGKKNEGEAENLLNVARIIHTEVGVEPYITFNFADLLDYIPYGGTSANFSIFNNFKEALDMSQGFFWVKFYSSDANTYPTGSEKLIADCVISFDFGTTQDMAQFRLTANSIQQAVGETKLIFNANGLTIQDGGLQVLGAGSDTLLSYNQDQKALFIKGNGVFEGTVYAKDGRFEGTVIANNGSFNGTITAQQGSIGGFTIGTTQLQGNDLILDASTGTISGGTIHLTTSAIIDDYIELGNARIYNPDVNNNLFITAGSNSEIIIKDTGIATFGGITIDGSTSTITGANYTITPNISTFNNIVATGKIVTSVFESNKIQTVGGSMLFRPSYKISSISGAILTLDTDIDITTNINANDKVILVKSDGNRLTDLFQVSSINGIAKTITLTTTPALNQGEVLNSIIILGVQGSLLIGINSTNNESSFLYPKGFTISEFSGSTTINKPKVYLGDLTTLGMGFSGYGLYGDNVYLNGSLITINHEANEQNYAGVNTLDGVSATIFGNSDTSNIIFWAGSISEQPTDIRQAKFQVTSKGSIYASQGKFTGSVISDTIISDSALYGTDIYGARLLGWNGDASGSSAALEIWNTRLGILFKRDIYTQVNISQFASGVTYYVISNGNYVKVAEGAEYNSETTYYTKNEEGETTLIINQNGLSFPHLSQNQDIILIDESDNNYVKFNGYSFSTDTLLVKGRTLQSSNNGLQNYLISINENESNQILIQAGNIQSTFSPSEINLNQSQLNCGGDVTYGNMMIYKRAYESSTVVGYDLYVG